MFPALLFASSRVPHAPEKVQLTIATLHAAALTTPRSAGDSTDAPFFVFEVIGPHASSASVLPESGQLRVHRDEAVGARPLTELTLAGGDSVQVLVSVLENAKAQSRNTPASASTRAISASAQVDEATRLVAPMIKDGAHLLGSVSMLVTNEGGAIYWRKLECVATCTVLNAPGTAALPAAAAVGGVVELSGNGGTYHLALQANRAQ